MSCWIRVSLTWVCACWHLLIFLDKTQEIISVFSACGGVGETPSWYQSLNPQQPCVSATIDSQSSICGKMKLGMKTPFLFSSIFTYTIKWVQCLCLQGFSCDMVTFCMWWAFCAAGSPTSTLKPKAGDNQVSGSSEDEDAETEAGPCEQSNDHADVKRIRRYIHSTTQLERSEPCQTPKSPCPGEFCFVATFIGWISFVSQCTWK